MAAREFEVGTDDTATTGVAANPNAPLAGEKVKVPVYADPADGPKAFVEFVNSLPAGGKVTVADKAPTTPTPKEGNAWFKSDTGSLFVFYGTPKGAWVEVGGGGSSGPTHFIKHAADPTAADGADGDIWFRYE